MKRSVLFLLAVLTGLIAWAQKAVVSGTVSHVGFHSQKVKLNDNTDDNITERQHFISVAKGILDMFKGGYGHGAAIDRVAIRKGRRLLSPKKSDTLTAKVMGGPVTALQLDMVKNTDILLDAEELNLYDLKMEMPTSIDDRRQYVVSISPRFLAGLQHH